ncbi:MAG: hypothetical protein LQ342_002039 [Letrouitia transgressa]|nr:MAG: hypothetical protein LQ342_002039 [Letrouitia transgressa]
MASSEDFDPFQQSFTLVLLDGTPFNVTIPDLDDFVRYSVQISINYAAQLGASLIFLIVLLLLTKPEKRKSPVFILNSVALAINVVRNLLQCLYYTGPFSEIYTYFSQDYSRVTASDYASQVTITVLSLLLLVCAELSLIMQVWVVCVTLRDLYKQGVTAFLVLVACLAVGFRFAFTIENAKLILSLNPPTSLNWLASASNIVTTISICLFSAVFIIKLGFALEQRRQLGMNHFGPMQILFIMGCQTLLIPGSTPPQEKAQIRCSFGPGPIDRVKQEDQFDRDSDRESTYHAACLSSQQDTSNVQS